MFIGFVLILLGLVISILLLIIAAIIDKVLELFSYGMASLGLGFIGIIIILFELIAKVKWA